MLVERNHVNQKKAQSMMPPSWWRGHYSEEGKMRFYRLTAVFFKDHENTCLEILNKQTWPYYVALLSINNLTFAIPLRSHLPVDRRFCFVADGDDAGLDFCKAVVITDTQRYLEPNAIQIRQHEFKVLQQHEFDIKQNFVRFLTKYCKQMKRIQNNPSIPIPAWCRYSALQYFHKELGI